MPRKPKPLTVEKTEYKFLDDVAQHLPDDVSASVLLLIGSLDKRSFSEAVEICDDIMPYIDAFLLCGDEGKHVFYSFALLYDKLTEITRIVQLELI